MAILGKRSDNGYRIKMTVIYISIQPNFSGGGPSVWAARMTQELGKRGHSVIFDKPNMADVAVCVISVGKVLKKINRNKTRVILRCDGIYQKEYNRLFNRAVRPDMIALHDDLRKNIPLIDHTVYQSNFSRDAICEEIIKYDKNYSIINNGADPNLFKPVIRPKDGFINLFTLGKLRDGYLMEMLIGTYLEVKKRHKVRLILAGNMDAACSKVYSKYKSDSNIIKLGSFKNTEISKSYAHADIFLAPRIGSSNDQVVVESLMHGIPCVVSKFGGNGELIENGKTGVIVDGGHWKYDENYIKNLAKGVEEIIPGLDGFKIRAREHAVKNLNLDIMVNKYLKAMGL